MTTFEAIIERAPRGGAFVAIPANVAESLGGGGRIPVVATFDGIEYRGSIVLMGGGPILGILKEIRTNLGRTYGDIVVVGVRRDDAERVVTIPPELWAALEGSPEARQAFESLSYSHQREHADHVAEAKKPETRVRRVEATIKRILG